MPSITKFISNSILFKIPIAILRYTLGTVITTFAIVGTILLAAAGIILAGALLIRGCQWAVDFVGNALQYIFQ